VQPCHDKNEKSTRVPGTCWELMEGMDAYKIGWPAYLSPWGFAVPTLEQPPKDSSRMRSGINLFTLYIILIGTKAANAQSVQDGCPKGDYACLDVINSSQCIEQLILEHLRPVTKDALVSCVEFEGMSSNLPGATKVSNKDKWPQPRTHYFKKCRLIDFFI